MGSAPSIGTGVFAGLESITPDELAASHFDTKYDFGYMASIADTAPETTGGDLPSWLKEASDLVAHIDWAKHSYPDATPALSANITAPIPLEQLPFHPDSGATTHISPDPNDFTVLHPINSCAIRGVNGSVIYATGIGDITIQVTSEDDINSYSTITLKDALYIPHATVHLVSVSALARFSGINSHFDHTGCWFTMRATGKTIACGMLSPPQFLYNINMPSAHFISHTLAATYTPNLEVWHRCLGHISYPSLQALARVGALKGVSSSTISDFHAPKCDTCILGKQTKSSVPNTRQEGHRATEKLGIVWVDLTGPMSVVSRTGNKYVMDILDDHTSKSWQIPLSSKDQALPEFQGWQMRIETQTGLKIRLLCIDGGELKSDEMNQWLASQGTSVAYTAPYTSAHIGRVECLHCTLQGRARAMCIHAKCPMYLWDEFYVSHSWIFF